MDPERKERFLETTLSCSDVLHADLREQGCALRRSVQTGEEVIDHPAGILTSRGRSVPVGLGTAVLREPQ